MQKLDIIKKVIDNDILNGTFAYGDDQIESGQQCLDIHFVMNGYVIPEIAEWHFDIYLISLRKCIPTKNTLLSEGWHGFTQKQV